MTTYIWPEGGGGGITELTGDVTAGPGAGSQTATVEGLQGNPVSSVMPADGQVLTWNGTAWVPGAPASGGSGGGGQTYFLNNGTAGQAPAPGGARQLGLVAEVPQTSVTSATLPSDGVTYALVAGFVTDLNVPGLTAIPAGIWDFNVWAQAAGPSLQPNTVRFRLKVYSWNGVTGTLLATSAAIPLYDPLQTIQYIAATLLPQTTLLATDRIYVEVEATATSNNHTITVYFGDATPSHVHTTLPSIAGTGIVHVINGVVQSPASPVDLSAGATEISGTLPAGNGGTGSSTVPASGDILVGNGSGYDPKTLSAGANISITNAPGSVTIAAAGSIGGTIAANEVAFGTGVDTIGGSPQLEWNPGTGVLTVADAATTPVFTVDTTTAIVDLTVNELRLAGAPGTAGEVLTSNGPGVAPTWQAGGGGGGAVFAGALTVYVDPVNGTDAPGGGTLGAPYATINYAYSQVPSLGDPTNVLYNANVGQFVTEKLIIQLAPGRYTENVVLGFKRGRVQLVGNGVQIIGSVTMRALRADFPAASMEAIKTSFPAPYTGAGTLATFEITGSCGGGVESDATADPLLVTGLTTLLFDEPTLPGSGLGTNWDNNYGQFNYYANKAYLLGGMVIATSYTVPTTNGLPTSVIEIDSCTIGESGITYRSFLGAVPYAYATNPTAWNKGTGVATGAQSSTTLQDTTKAWTVNEYAGATVTLTSGTGATQTRTVVSNTATTLTVAAWTTTPVAGSTVYSLVGTTNKTPTGTITLKCHNSTLGASVGPRLTLGELDGCRIYDVDRTMLGTVDNGSIVGSASSSYLGTVINQFRQFSGTGYPPSQYQLGSALSGARYKIDSTSYTTLAFNRSSTTGVLTARTLNLPTSSGTATAGAGTTLTDTTKTWNTNQWAGGTLVLTGGTGSGQTRTITANTATQITVSPAFSPAPTAGTTYTVTALVAFDLQDDARSLAYTPTTGAQWLDPDPTTVGSALDKVGGLGLLAAAPTNGQIPIGNGTNFTPATLTAGSGITVTNGAGTITIAATGGGTVTSVTASAPLASSGGATPNVSLTGAVGVANGGTGLTATPANGQLLLGNGSGFTLGTLTAGEGVTITNGSGSATVAVNANGPQSIVLDATATGGTATVIGTIYVPAPRTLNVSPAFSLAYIGGSLVGDTTVLTLNPAGGGAAVATWQRTGTLGSQTLTGGGTIAAAGWYDLTLQGTAGSGVAFARGLYLA